MAGETHWCLERFRITQLWFLDYAWSIPIEKIHVLILHPDYPQCPWYNSDSGKIPYNQMNNPMKFGIVLSLASHDAPMPPWFVGRNHHLRFPLGRRLWVAAGLCGTDPQQPADRQRAAASPLLLDLLGSLQGHQRWEILGQWGFLNGKMFEVNGWMFNIAIITHYQFSFIISAGWTNTHSIISMVS